VDITTVDFMTVKPFEHHKVYRINEKESDKDGEETQSSVETPVVALVDYDAAVRPDVSIATIVALFAAFWAFATA
jgi:hypothetical protein